MDQILWFVFYFRLPNGREIDAEVVGRSFEACLKDAQKRAAYAKAKIIAWVEL